MTSIEHVLEETRTFHPTSDFSEMAHIKTREEYDEMYKRSINAPDEFWGDQAEHFHWFKKWDTVLNKDNAPFYKWFEGGTTNLCYNCVDRHLTTWRKNKAAIIWEGEPGDTRTLTYQQLHREVCKFANVLKKLGVKQGEPSAVVFDEVGRETVPARGGEVEATHVVVSGELERDLWYDGDGILVHLRLVGRDGS